MAVRAGLRTEIIVSLSLLLVAALLFAGFLLVKLTEHNLLEQQRFHAATVTRLIAAGVESSATAGDAATTLVSRLDRLQTIVARQPDILAWRVLDTRLQVLASTAYSGASPFQDVSPSVLAHDELLENLSYRSFNLFGGNDEDYFIDMSTALHAADEPFALLQVRISLAPLHLRVQAAQQLILIYVIAYGLILTVFGVFLLNRNVVKPVRRLRQATADVAAGEMAEVAIDSGPGEIHDLAASFNQMVAALTASRAETEAHITSLEEANRALGQARDELVRSEKLATVGHLAAGMAHEIGNPLAAVIGYLGILKEDLSGDERDLAERSLEETARIDRLVRELLDYASPVRQEEERFDPAVSLREAVDLLRHQGQFDQVSLDDSALEELGCVSMDRGRLMQVWINLLLNARDAMAGAGEVALSSAREGALIALTVSDRGAGIRGEEITRIFEPFYTSKAPGSGYGLGLAVCQRIVDDAGGRIRVSSESGRGTSFTVTLPLDDSSTDAVTVAEEDA
jgi:signal transduction histidine kinase